MQKSKWRVLIVDDEFRIGMLIKKLIHWDDLEMECVDVVDNGETAYNIIQKVHPDILITDIRMPKINGLDLIRMTKELYSDIKFIVISGYKEFEYAHRALQYEVESYLLKPVNQNELNEVLEKINQKLKDRRDADLEKHRIQEALSESRQIIKRDFLKNIIEMEEDYDSSSEKYEMSGEVYRGMDIKLDYFYYDRTDPKQDRITVERIQDIVNRILEPIVEDVILCEKENLHIYCLFSYDCRKAKDIKNSINDVLSNIQNYLMGFDQYEVSIGVGTEKYNFGEIRFSIKEAYCAVGNRIRLGTGRLIYAEMIPASSRKNSVVKKQAENLVAAIESYSVDRMVECINLVFKEFMDQKDRDYSEIYDVVEELLDLFFQKFSEDHENVVRIHKKISNQCQHCRSIVSLKKCLKDDLGEYLENSWKVAENEMVKPIRQAKRYVDEHYSEKIVLEDIAEIVGLNSAYFSVLFKKETGMNFSAYLIMIRMEKAKEMLCSTNETIASIGEMVGYKDSRYFSQLFIKTVGVKPALYRRLHS